MGSLSSPVSLSRNPPSLPFLPFLHRIFSLRRRLHKLGPPRWSPSSSWPTATQNQRQATPGSREELLQPRDLLASSATDLAFRHSGGPPLAQLCFEELPGGLTCTGTGPNGSGWRSRTGAASFLYEHHFSALVSFQITRALIFELIMS